MGDVARGRGTVQRARAPAQRTELTRPRVGADARNGARPGEGGQREARTSAGTCSGCGECGERATGSSSSSGGSGSSGSRRGLRTGAGNSSVEAVGDGEDETRSAHLEGVHDLMLGRGLQRLQSRLVLGPRDGKVLLHVREGLLFQRGEQRLREPPVLVRDRDARQGVARHHPVRVRDKRGGQVSVGLQGLGHCAEVTSVGWRHHSGHLER